MVDIEEKNPLKQGLKHLCLCTPCSNLPNIEEKNPLKQGLKLNPVKNPIISITIEEKNPLKQGLKHYIYYRILLVTLD